MAKIVRKEQKIFAGSAANNGQFGSAQAGTKITTTDPDTVQALAAYDQGWDSAVISGKRLPPLEEMQSLDFVNTYQLAYLFQEGIPEWNTDTEYHKGSIVKSGNLLYSSLIDTNEGNLVTDTASWHFSGDVSSLSSIDSVMNLGLATSVAANALTIDTKQKDGATDPTTDIPSLVPFRDNSLSDGARTLERFESSLTVVVPSGATLGTKDGVNARIYVYAIDKDAPEIAVSLSLFDESKLHSSVLIDASADSASVLYSTSAKTSKPLKLLGFIESSQATAGTWLTATSLISSSDKVINRPDEYSEAAGDFTVTDTNWTTSSAKIIPYKTANGTWRANINISGTYSATVTLGTLTISGLTFANISGGQNINARSAANDWSKGRANDGAASITIVSGTTATVWLMSGDVELGEKPSWANEL